MATGNTFHFADLLHCPYLTQLFPKRWITGYAEFHPSDGNNVNLLSLVGELALFSHKVPLNKLLLLNGTTVTSKVLFFFFSFSYHPLTLHSWAIFFPLKGKKSSFVGRHFTASLLTSIQKIACCYSYNLSTLFSLQTLGHKILYHIIIPIFTNENHEVKATEGTWWLNTGDQNSDLWL